MRWDRCLLTQLKYRDRTDADRRLDRARFMLGELRVAIRETEAMLEQAERDRALVR